jgi:hypothetical protein
MYVTPYRRMSVRNCDALNFAGAIAAPGGVEPAQHVAAETCGRHLMQEFGRIAEQHADVDGLVAVDEREQRGSTRGCLAQVLAPGPLPVGVLHRNRVRSSTFSKQLLDGVARHPLVLANRQ